MSNIDFQNGFLCGMATKGLSRSGNMYEPIVWNDSGVYTYFYIDFKRAIETFSLGMAQSSLVVMDSSKRDIVNVERVSGSVYQIFCDISDCPPGIVILNKKTGYLRFASGAKVPAFSVHMFVEGQGSYIDAGYYYDSVRDAKNAIDFSLPNVTEIALITLAPAVSLVPISEIVNCSYSFSPHSQIIENASVELTEV